MPGKKLKTLSSVFASALKNTPKNSNPNQPPELVSLEKLFSSTNPSSSTNSSSQSLQISLNESPTFSSKQSTSSITHTPATPTETSDSPSSNSEDSSILREISSMLCGNTASESVSLPTNDNGKLLSDLDIPWFSNLSNLSNISILQRRKEILRERKKKWIFKNTQAHRFERLIKMCADNLGPEAALKVFGKLGRQTGVKEYNAMIKVCIEQAKKSNDDEGLLDHIHMAFRLIRSMREQGFPLMEESYGPLLMYLVDMGMVQEFQFFSEFVKDENPSSFCRLGYYEMLLWLSVNDEDKVQELSNSIGLDSGENNFQLAESYLLALCGYDREKEILRLLEVVDLTRISSVDKLTTIFKFFGRLQLEKLSEKYLSLLKLSETGAENISCFIYSYAISMPNLAVEGVILEFKNLHRKFEVSPSFASCDMLIAYCCDSLKVREAFDIVNYMSQSGLALSVETFHPILHASGQNFELDLVHRIHSVMHHHGLKPNGETFRSMINSCVKMKDFEGAHNMLRDVEEMNMTPTSNMYNTIMSGYFREKNIEGGLRVLKQMQHSNVQPDSETFSYLIGFSKCEKDIVKYHEEMKHAQIQVTKHVYMAFINAYANCGQFDKAKEVVLDQGIPIKYINEIKSALVGALASNGHISGSLEVYKEIKQAGGCVEPKAIISLIENLQSEGELDKLLQLLVELSDSSSWFEGCRRVAVYCVRYKHLSSAVDLLKQLKETDELETYVVCNQMFSQIFDRDIDLEFGLDLLRAIKEEVGLHPSRTSLDFLLSTCVSAKDTDCAQLIWDEYQKAGLSFNILTFMRMYQIMMASGKKKSAIKLLKNIEKDDPHVRCIIKACEATYSERTAVKGKKIRLRERN